MAKLTIGGKPVNTIGALPEIGKKAPDFLLTRTDLSDISLKDVAGKKVVLNIFPSVDTPVCSASVRRFNQEISNFPGAVVLCASMDLPFAHARFCETEGLKDVIAVSEIRSRKFGDDYGLRMVDGPLAGLLARAVIVIDNTGKVIYSKIVEELKNEPNYQEVLSILKAGNDHHLDICTKSGTAEHSRPDNSDEPCDDGRSG
jgi:thioredoxin-dependent peroxiredoxin